MPRKKTERLPVLPLRGLMVFPHMVLHFDVGRKKSLEALETAIVEDQRVFLVCQHDAGEEDPKLEDLYRVGTVSRVKQVLKLPGDNVRVLVEGSYRAKLTALSDEDGYLLGSVQALPDGMRQSETEMDALLHATQEYFENYAKSSGRIPAETLSSVLAVEEPAQLAEQIDKNQKDYYLREQIRAIQTELGDRDANDVEDLRERMDETPLNEEARAKVERELGRVERMQPGTPEIGVSRNYVEWILDLPWGKTTPDNLDLKRARRILDEDHDGMDKVKERIVEYLAVSRMKGTLHGPILCLVGPPGVGKTSIAKSVARALGRKFTQMSLGGVRDEAEIRGHRRTYIGAIPGRILYGMKQAGTMNPVFLFDEIDKMSHDFQGDPASAMLEVLDAQQNMAFRDHYLELPFDLSQVLFLTTANDEGGIPGPLRDRMEVIRLSSYTEEEKLSIAKHHLVPRQLREHGLTKAQVRVNDKALRAVIDGYTREAGVRQLEREIAALMRKAAMKLLDEEKERLSVTPDNLREFLGRAIFLREKPDTAPEVGVARGLAYTELGGETLAIETTTMPGAGALQLTGQLGDVMKESAQAAMSYVRAHADTFGLSPDFHKTLDTHIHVPEGAVPKDGPSAGVAITCSLVSALTGIPLRQDVAMTGEITLRGRVLPVGGIKEKLLAAHRAGIDTIMLPAENEPDLEDLPRDVREMMRITFLHRVDEALAVVLTRTPQRWTPALETQKTTAPTEVQNGH